MNVIILARKKIGAIEDLPSIRIETGLANSDECIAAELVFITLGTNYERVPTAGKNSLAPLLDGRIDTTIFTGSGAYAPLNSINAKNELALLVQAAGSR